MRTGLSRFVEERGYASLLQMHGSMNLARCPDTAAFERGPMILTSNQSFGAWGEVFGERVIATAILDRLLHHAVTLNIRGNSYRLKEMLKAGPVRAEETTSS